jgi:His/Glu/Gln/Arg/opine family amino acid ABC transporter permease subunit
MDGFIDLKGYGWTLWTGVAVTVEVGICAAVVAILMGLLGAWGKLSKSRVARTIANVYTVVVRGVPELVLILLCYYGLTILLQEVLSLIAGEDILIDIDPFSAGVITLGVIYGAFATEVFRGAFLAVPKGQVEAALATGMSRMLIFRRVLMPQAWRFALPGLGNVWLVLTKATSLMSVIQLSELLRNADVAARAKHMPFTFYFLASLFYLAITILSMVGQQRIEAWANRGVRRASPS